MTENRRKTPTSANRRGLISGLAALLHVVLQGFIPNWKHGFVDGTEGCSTGCDVPAMGWPLRIIEDKLHISVEGRADWLGALIGDNIVHWPQLGLVFFTSWAIIYVILKIIGR